MDLNINRVVIILNNNSAQVMNEKDIKQSIRIYVTKVYDKENSTMQQLKEKISISKIEKLMINAHTSWYSHLIKDNDKSYDINQTYDLLNNTKVLVDKRHERTTSSVNTFNGRYSVLSTLLAPIKLKVYNFSHRHYGESTVHSGSMIEINIPQNSFIAVHCVLIHCGTPSSYIESGIYHQNTRSFFL